MAAIEYDVTIFLATVWADVCVCVCVLIDASWSVDEKSEEWLQWYKEINVDTAGGLYIYFVSFCICIALRLDVIH